VVNDLETMVEFYRDVVGLPVRARGAGTATLGAGGRPLLELAADPDAPARSTRSAGLFHNALRVPSRAALGDVLGRIRESWELTGASDHHVSEARYLDDPEGNGVEVYRDRPRDEWPTDERGRVEMDTLPLDLDALAAEAGGEASVPARTDVGHVHLEVSNLSAARRFYVEVVGLNVCQEWGVERAVPRRGELPPPRRVEHLEPTVREPCWSRARLVRAPRPRPGVARGGPGAVRGGGRRGHPDRRRRRLRGSGPRRDTGQGRGGVMCLRDGEA
jgi:catechol 2,3-dioxygenase-like lactoylglutathione lyase family enzyme